MKYLKYYLLALFVVVIDQTVKLIIHTTMDLGDEISIFGDWFKLHYTLNPGMAFGIQFGSEYGKLVLTLFRFVAMFGIGYYIYLSTKRAAHVGFIVCIAMILGGAAGNLVDSIFYGSFLDNAPTYYEDNKFPLFYPWLHGQVIDMFYFDIWEGTIADSVPLIGGSFYSFWPIFNVADASIFMGVFSILIFQKRFFPAEKIETVEEPIMPETTPEQDVLNIENK